MSSAPNKAAVKASISSQEQTDPELESAVCTGDRERVELDGRSSFFKLRRHWSIALMAWISSFILFHAALTIAIGLGGLDYLEYQWLIPLITVENFLQIVGMGYIVVRFLYPSDIQRADSDQFLKTRLPPAARPESIPHALAVAKVASSDP